MRIVNGLLCLVMLLFAGVQYNDPDLYYWIPVYLVPAAWTGIAALRPGLLRRPMAAIVLGICIVLAAAQTLQAWPQDAGWWQQEVWWQSELAREGMGMMIVTVVLLIVALTLWRVRRGGAAPA